MQTKLISGFVECLNQIAVEENFAVEISCLILGMFWRRKKDGIIDTRQDTTPIYYSQLHNIYKS